MTSSATYDFSPSVGQCVLSAYDRIQIRGPAILQEHMNTARMESNLQMVQFSNLQPNLWKVDLVTTSLTNGVTTYAVQPRTVMILDAWITTNAGSVTSNDLLITPLSRTEYASISNKTSPGRPTSFWFDRLISPTVTLWPVPNNSSFTLSYYRCVQVQDTNLAGGETPDLPYLWLDAYVAGLAYRFARVYKPELEAVRKADANEAWRVAATQNVENTPMSLKPTISTYYRR